MRDDFQAAQRLDIEERVEETMKPRGFSPDDIEGGSYAACAIRVFLTGVGTISPGSQFKIKGDELWFIRRHTKHKRRALLARKVKGVFIGNSSGIAMRQNGELALGRNLEVQRTLARYIPMVPFTVFKETGLKLENMRIIDRGAEEKIDLGRENKETGEKIIDHYTGALLFAIGTHHYLFDIDRNDLKLKNMNAFMSRIPKPCKTIKEAYASLKPQEVYEAEKFLGLEVERQGEWFFIPIKGDYTAKRGETARLQSKGNRAHFVERISEEGYVKGVVSHGGYEHKPITLKTWCKAVPNTAIESFKITGAID